MLKGGKIKEEARGGLVILVTIASKILTLSAVRAAVRLFKISTHPRKKKYIKILTFLLVADDVSYICIFYIIFLLSVLNIFKYIKDRITWFISKSSNNELLKYQCLD